jgi:hypothetical protein
VWQLLEKLRYSLALLGAFSIGVNAIIGIDIFVLIVVPVGRFIRECPYSETGHN